jgi:hypothetical protein
MQIADWALDLSVILLRGCESFRYRHSAFSDELIQEPFD